MATNELISKLNDLAQLRRLARRGPGGPSWRESTALRRGADVAYHQRHLFPGLDAAGSIVQYSYPDVSFFVFLKMRGRLLPAGKRPPLLLRDLTRE